MSFDSIRESLRNIKSSPEPQRFRNQFGRMTAPSGSSLIGDQQNLPESVFGKELRERMEPREEGGEGEAKLKTELIKSYTHEELGEKLKRLRPEAAEKGKKDWFSLEELNLRLAKLRELEDEESKSRASGLAFFDLKQSLMKLKDAEINKRAGADRKCFLFSSVYYGFAGGYHH